MKILPSIIILLMLCTIAYAEENNTTVIEDNNTSLIEENNTTVSEENHTRIPIAPTILSNYTSPLLAKALNASLQANDSINPYGAYHINESYAVDVIDNANITLTEPDSNGHIDYVENDGDTRNFHVGRLTISTTPNIQRGGFTILGHNFFGSQMEMSTEIAPTVVGNLVSKVDSSGDVQFDEKYYTALIKENITLNNPVVSVGYDYNLALSDWTIKDWNNTFSTEYANNSTVDIHIDVHGNAIVSINNDTTVVIPKPFTNDVNGVRHELNWTLDTEAQQLNIEGLDEIDSSLYPLLIDPSEMVYNGGFESGSATGWATTGSVCPYTGGWACYGNYGCCLWDSGTISQVVTLDNVPAITWAGRIQGMGGYTYNTYVSIDWVRYGNYADWNFAPHALYINGYGGHTLTFGEESNYGDTTASFDGISAMTNVPICDFGQTYSAIWAGQANTFTDYSYGDATGWWWSFGDGTYASDQNPAAHTYNTPGTYTVQHVAGNPEGNSATASHTTTVWQPITNAFTASATTVNVGQSIQFTDQSTGTSINYWWWDFGDGTTSQAQNPTHTYAAAGTYPVFLRAGSSVTGDYDDQTKSNYIRVNLPVTAEFSVTGTLLPNNVLQFIDASTGNPSPNQWSWNFGDGATSTLQNPTHAYTTSGQKTVTLTATNSVGSSYQISHYVNILAPVVCDYVGSPTAVFTGQSVQFTDTSTGSSIDSWQWDFGDGNTSTLQNPSHVYSTAGTYNTAHRATSSVTGTYQDTYKNNYITVNVATGADFSFTGNKFISNSIQFTDLSTGSPLPDRWQWDFGDGTANLLNVAQATCDYGYGYSSANGVLTYDTTTKKDGAKSVKFVTSGSGDNFFSIYTQMLSVSPNTQYTFSSYVTGNTAALCRIIYYGSVGYVGETGGYAVTADGTWQRPTCTFTTPSNCIWCELRFQQPNSGTNYWDDIKIEQGGAATQFDNVQNPTHTYTAAGIYTVALNATNNIGSTSTTTRQISIAAPVTAGWTTDKTALRAGESVQFTDQSTGTNITNWAWNFGDGTSSSLQHPSHTYASGGIYTVALTASSYSSGSSNTLTRNSYITVYSPIVTDFSANTQQVFTGNAVQFYDRSTGSPTTWLWNFGDGNTSTEQNPVYIYGQVGTYAITLNSSSTVSGFTDEKTKAGWMLVQEAPYANFNATPKIGESPLEVQFNDTSIGSPTSWYWTFGDGETSTDRNPKHTYSGVDAYRVSLTVTNDAGSNTLTKLNYIATNYKAEQNRVQYSVSATQGAAPLVVNFIDSSTGASLDNYGVTRQWNFGDGNTVSGQNTSDNASVQHIYTQPGTYQVQLQIMTGSGTTAQNVTLYVGGAGDNIAPLNYTQYASGMMTSNTTLWELPMNVASIYTKYIPSELFFLLIVIIIFVPLYIRTGSTFLPSLLYCFLGGFLAFAMPNFFGNAAFYFLALGLTGVGYKLFISD